MALLTPSSSFCYGFTYDVFLSFRGLDTRYGFTGNLYIALHNKGIHTFIDNEELERGQEITPSLLKAIEESRIAIIILSENYASSSFCLDELVKILDDIKGKGRLVLPIFYDIDPSIVRKQAGSYGEALAMHEERFKSNMQRLHKWRSALQQVANLSGWHFKKGVHDLIEDMDKEIVRLESPDEPGKRSRLWFHEDIIQVLEDNTGTSAIKTIYLICENEVELDESAFKKMKNLKTLVIIIMKGGHFTKGPKYLPNSVRVVKWEGYPSEYLPQDFHPKKLAILTLRKSCITSLETDSLKKFLNVKILNFDEANCLTEIPDVSCLLNLEEFSFYNCNNLIKIHESVGLLDKLKVLSARGCTKLRRFPPIKLASLEQLDLSFCLNLKSFPEILGKIENITELVLEGIPIIDLPFSFQNLTHLQTLQLRCCGTFSLPRNLFMMPNLVVIIAWGLNGLILPKQSEGEQTVILTVTSNVERLYLPYCRLSNDFFATSLTWFRNVKELILTGNNFTILPECIKEYHLLSELHVDDCKYLREVRGIPPNLEIFSAHLCKSWTSTEMLLNQELHEAGSTMFKLPGSRIPDWFEHCSSGGSISFWFRNKFPAIALCLVPDSMFVISSIYPIVIINGKESQLDSRNRNEYGGDHSLYVRPDHTYIFDLQKIIKFEDNLDEALLNK